MNLKIPPPNFTKNATGIFSEIGGVSFSIIPTLPRRTGLLILFNKTLN
jgi:hypothetical protein